MMTISALAVIIIIIIINNYIIVIAILELTLRKYVKQVCTNNK